MELYLHSATCLFERFSNSHRKILTFFSLSNTFTKSIHWVAMHSVSLHLFGQILDGDMYIVMPILWRQHPPTKIFQQKSCPLVIQGLDSKFWISSGTQIEKDNGSHIISYFADDGDVKAKMIPVITGKNRTISRSFRKYFSNIPGKHERKEIQKIEKEPYWTLHTYVI